jgi:hypothetical protein
MVLLLWSNNVHRKGCGMMTPCDGAFPGALQSILDGSPPEDLEIALLREDIPLPEGAILPEGYVLSSVAASSQSERLKLSLLRMYSDDKAVVAPLKSGAPQTASAQAAYLKQLGDLIADSLVKRRKI